jgi:hypothetical protein
MVDIWLVPFVPVYERDLSDRDALIGGELALKKVRPTPLENLYFYRN